MCAYKRLCYRWFWPKPESVSNRWYLKCVGEREGPPHQDKHQHRELDITESRRCARERWREMPTEQKPQQRKLDRRTLSGFMVAHSDARWRWLFVCFGMCAIFRVETIVEARFARFAKKTPKDENQRILEYLTIKLDKLVVNCLMCRV